MPCPKCESYWLVKKGNYKTKKRIIKKRYKCKDCGLIFVERNENFRQKLEPMIKLKIMSLWKTKKGFVNKFDNLKKETYSTREIAKKLNVSKSFVHQLIKNRKI